MVDYADIDDFRNKLSLFRRRVIICEVLFLMLGLLFFVSAYLTSGKGPYPGDLLAILTVCSLFGSLIWYFIMSYLVSKWTAEMFGNRCPFCGKKLWTINIQALAAAWLPRCYSCRRGLAESHE